MPRKSEALSQSTAIPLIPVTTGLWRTHADEAWSNPGGGLWGGYAIGLAIRVLEEERDAVGEALSLTLTYAAALPVGDIDIRTRRIRQGGSVGVWEVEMLPAGTEQVGVHAIVTMARRPDTPPFAFAQMPQAPDPESLPNLDPPGQPLRYGATAFERRALDGFPPEPGTNSRSLAWVRPRHGVFDKALLGMVTDHSPPRAMYALGRSVWTTTLTLTAYLHATAEDLVAIGSDYILVECEGRVGSNGASDELSSYWSRSGKLLATSEQLAWYREMQRSAPE